jgi:hypothetical protein
MEEGHYHYTPNTLHPSKDARFEFSRGVGKFESKEQNLFPLRELGANLDRILANIQFKFRS